MTRARLYRLLLLAALGSFAARGLAEEAAPAQGDAAEQAAAQFRGELAPLFEQHCQACHAGEEPTGGVAFDELLSRLDVGQDRELWEKIAGKLHSGEMPPEGEALLAPEGRMALTTWIDGQLANFGCGEERDPGRVTIRRLNRNEYNNTIRDLLGVDFRPANEFPSDDVGYGFDNIGDVLSMPPILLEKYLAAAEQITSRLFAGEKANLLTSRLKGGELLAGGTRVLASGAVEVTADTRLPGSGEFLVRVKAWGDQAGDEPVKMLVKFAGQELRFDVEATSAKPQVYEAWVSASGGELPVSIVLENDYYAPDEPAPNDRNLYVASLEVTGPFPPSFKRLVTEAYTPENKLDLAREILGDVMTRAYRRPIEQAELDRVMKLVEAADRDGESLVAAVSLALQAILVSPNFLFRVELDPEQPDEIRTLNEFELATRLSYFLWSSMPDAELFELARANKLREGDNLERQVRRMLADGKSRALVENFAGQWLQLRNLKIVFPAPRRYPAFDEGLRRAMLQETELFFTEIMRQDLRVLTFLDSDFTFLNERLAKHYEISGVTGREFRKVKLEGDQRGGVLTQASVLTVTSNPTRTSPVKRGKWVLENIFGTPPPPPPPDVPELNDDGKALTGSLRERTEQHRANPACAVCHVRMDPLGFGLENFDGIGAWRTKDGEFDIDASGELPGGKKFAGPAGLKQILLSQRDDFVRCLSEKMLTYALGRGVEYSDRCTVQDIAQATEAGDYKFSAMILAIVHSDAFQKRRGTRSEP